MTIQLSQNPELAAACMEVAKKFSEADLREHPKTEEVMSCFAEQAEFSGWCLGGMIPFNVGKKIAEIGFKYLCEESVKSFELTSEVKFEEKSDHILWSFDSIQLRQGIFPAWIKGPQWYKIHGVAKLYFSKLEDGVRISKYESIKNEWIPHRRGFVVVRLNEKAT